MKVKFIFTGKTAPFYVKDGLTHYCSRLAHYFPLTIIETAGAKKPLSGQALLQFESGQVLKNLNENDYLVLLDQNGKKYSSEQWAKHLNKLFQLQAGSLVFVIGGAFGFDPLLLKRSNEKFSLSEMTFNHQMARLIFAEQMYRAMTILRNEKYHHA